MVASCCPIAFTAYVSSIGSDLASRKLVNSSTHEWHLRARSEDDFRKHHRRPSYSHSISFIKEILACLVSSIRYNFSKTDQRISSAVHQRRMLSFSVQIACRTTLSATTTTTSTGTPLFEKVGIGVQVTLLNEPASTWSSVTTLLFRFRRVCVDTNQPFAMVLLPLTF